MTPPAKPAPPVNDRDDVVAMMTAMSASLVASTYPAPQAESVLSKVAETYETTMDVELLPTVVLTQAHHEGYPTMRKIRGSYRFDQMVAAQSVIAQARLKKPPARDVTNALNAVGTMKPRYPAWLRILGYALSSFGFAACFQMDVAALAGAFVMGLIIGVLVFYSSKLSGLTALVPFLATLLTGLMVGVTALITGSPDPVRLVAMPVVVLLPGAVLTSGLIELVSGYMVSGTARLVYAVMILGSMAFGFVLAVQMTGLSSSRLEDLTSHLTPLWVSWVGAVVFGIGTFLYFCTPLRLWLPSLVVMVVSYYISMTSTSGMSAAIAAGIATFVGLLLSWVINARIGGGPGAFVIFLPTFWLIVPGSAVFVVITGGIELSSNLTVIASQAGLTFLAMAIGMMLATAFYPLIAKIQTNVTWALRRSVEFFPTHLEPKRRKP